MEDRNTASGTTDTAYTLIVCLGGLAFIVRRSLQRRNLLIF